jgi:CTP:molybdopterin cytidylyltransferase MocA
MRDVRGVVAVVPAAGAARRFGGAKLVADIGGEPLLQHTLRCLLDASIARVVLVTPPGETFPSVPLAGDARVVRVSNPAPDRGMFSSIQVGLTAVDAGDAVLVLPADMPFVRPDTVRRLVSACANGEVAVVATYDGRRGHPVVIPAAVCERLRREPAASSMKDALLSIGVSLATIPVDDPGVLRDVDVRSDLEGWEASGRT